jgi:endo-1,3-1,4-beta-glycanase ExoK
MSIQIASVILSAASVVSGGSLTCTVKLNAVPNFEVVASIGADPASSVLVPSTLTFSKGAQSASFAVDAKAVTAATTVTLYVNYNVTQHGSFSITPAVTPTPPTPTPVPPVPTPVPPVGTPTFSDNFSGGSLNTENWIVSNWTSDNYAGAGNNVTFSPSAISLSEGLLQMTLTQPTSGTSTGAELQSKNTYGFGTYQVVMRMSSTAATSTAAGSVVSGSDSAFFSFINNSQTEIDIEFCGNTPNNIWLTNWDTTNLKTYTEPAAANLASGFHTYTVVWTSTSITWSIDGTVVATHTTNIPQTPAYIMINFWGTNSSSWGGVATPGVTRYFYVQSVSFTPAA